MLIGINEKQEVIFVSDDGVMTPDNQTFFAVANVPKEEKGKQLCFDPEAQVFYKKSLPQVPESVRKARIERAKNINEAEIKKEAALKWLADNDWKVNKVVIGEWAVEDPRWREYLAQRAQIRLAIDAADEILNS